MELRTDYPLSVPNDAIATVNSGGIFGAPYVAIDATHAAGPLVTNGGQIHAQESAPPLSLESIDRLLKGAEIVTNLDKQKKGAGDPARPPEARTPPQKPRPN